MIDFTEITTPEKWEVFTRDFLDELGFRIESPPVRGPDQGKDMLFIERLSGSLGKTDFRWLVSCKQFAKSNSSVGLDGEPSILERLRHVQGGRLPRILFYDPVLSPGGTAASAQGTTLIKGR